MAPREHAHPDLHEVELVTVLAALAEPTRLRIVRMLAALEGERAWKDIDLPIAQSTLSHHLKILRNAGLVQNRTEGTRCFISLRDEELEGRFPGLLESVLSCGDPVPLQTAAEKLRR
ncbi:MULTISPECIES: ArsR/SmtB family transcription factor [Nocardiopsis]|uniref:DNA-binding transcriptional ArsR family regulator n=1 Tax=Nocardiopsis sinuspersici TaxID=501010 RepID=A0A7Z0BM16_9ACTN|nr:MULTISPECIES: metalloregulator ArsR/SmtB family transcription factor [Nocardiopsis]NYH53974.1 DNA-binding transcriptional ArsR family regulator [Nocardiopsis sinuspersici]